MAILLTCLASYAGVAIISLVGLLLLAYGEDRVRQRAIGADATTPADSTGPTSGAPD